MKTLTTLVILLASLVPTKGTEILVPYKTLFEEKFSAKEISKKKWNIPTWYSPYDGTFVGRTQFRCTQNEPLPEIKKGSANIELETFNPTGFSMYGTDLITNRYFRTTTDGILITFKAKMLGPMPKGMVAGLFLYSVKDNGLHDEIDFELLGNTLGRVHTNIYSNEPLGVGDPESYSMTSGSATTWHKYQILWSKTKVVWYVDNKPVRMVTSVDRSIPAGPMYLHVNVWAPDAGWVEAYDSGLQPVSSYKQNRSFFLLLDSVKIEAMQTSK